MIYFDASSLDFLLTGVTTGIFIGAVTSGYSISTSDLRILFLGFSEISMAIYFFYGLIKFEVWTGDGTSIGVGNNFYNY